jgi:hypothetical protein
MRPSMLALHAAWTLGIAHVLSLVYELWRATVRAGTSRHDSMRAFVLQGAWLYVVAAAVVAALLAGAAAGPWLALAFTVAMIGVSIGYYNPVVLVERLPGPIDWVEDLLYTGLLFVAGILLLYEVLGYELS